MVPAYRVHGIYVGNPREPQSNAKAAILLSTVMCWVSRLPPVGWMRVYDRFGTDLGGRV